MVVEINHKLCHCITYNATCEMKMTQVMRTQQLAEKKFNITYNTK